MHPKRFITFLKDPVWSRIISFSLILFFVFLGDAILSFWVPNLLQDSLKSPFMMGLVMSFSSLIGFLVDLTFPQFIKGFTVKRLLVLGISTSIAFSVSLLISLKLPLILIFLFAMAVWGIYYEFLGFSNQQFIADSMPLKMRAGGWAILGVFKGLAYLLGPLIAPWLILNGEYLAASFAIILAFISLIVVLLTRRTHDRPLGVDVAKVDLFAEMKHWVVLTRVVWPIVVLSLFLGIIDATFWTTGTVLTEELARGNFWGSLLIPAYQLPALFVGFVVAKMQIYQTKKRLASFLLLASGIALSVFALINSVYWFLFATLVSSILLAIIFPLTDSIYTDIIVRMGKERKHMMGLSSSTISMAYIIGPSLAGFIAKEVGEIWTFSVIGSLVVLVSLVLLIFTREEIRLPEREIQKWQ